MITARDPLPIDAVLPDLLRALERSPRAVLVAAPGAGKTTRVPARSARRAVAPRWTYPGPRAAPACCPCGGRADGGDARRGRRRDGRLSRAPRHQGLGADADRSRHRGRLHPHGRRRPRPRRRRRGALRRVPRAVARRRSRPRARARQCLGPARGPAHRRHVRDARRRPCRRAPRRCSGDRERGPGLPGRDAVCSTRSLAPLRGSGGGDGAHGARNRSGFTPRLPARTG